MKKVKVRTVQMLLFTWSSVVIYSYGVLIIQDIKSAMSSAEFLEINIIPFLVLLGIYAVATIVWVLRAKKDCKGTKFLKSQVVILDEDERGYILHFKASEKAMNFVQVASIIIFFSFYQFGNFVINIVPFMIIGAILYTFYLLIYYNTLKKLYYA